MGESGQVIDKSGKPTSSQKLHGPLIAISHNEDGTVDLGTVGVDPKEVYTALASKHPKGMRANLWEVLRGLLPRGTSVHSPEEPKI